MISIPLIKLYISLLHSTQRRRFYTRRRNLKTEVSFWIHIRCFPLSREIYKGNNHRSFWFCVRVKRTSSFFWKASFWKCSAFTLKRNWAAVFRFLRLEEHFQKAAFSWRISVDGRSDCRKKAAFSNSSGVVWTLFWIWYHGVFRSIASLLERMFV